MSGQFSVAAPHTSPAPNAASRSRSWGFKAMGDGVLSAESGDPSRAVRPYTRDREGFVFGEGAVALCLERESRAEALADAGRRLVLWSRLRDSEERPGREPDARRPVCRPTALLLANRSARSSRSTVICWEVPGWSTRRPPPWRCTTRVCVRPPTTRTPGPIRNATTTTSATDRGRPTSASRCPWPSPSARQRPWAHWGLATHRLDHPRVAQQHFQQADRAPLDVVLPVRLAWSGCVRDARFSVAPARRIACHPGGPARGTRGGATAYANTLRPSSADRSRLTPPGGTARSEGVAARA